MKIDLCRNGSKGRETVVLLRRRQADAAVAGGAEEKN